VWGPHINNICNKANSTIGFLKRNLNIANKSVKERAYQSLMRPSLEYSSAVWDPHQQQDKQRFVGNIQISLEEADGRVCFVADVVDVRSPF
jgi:hypothetical protein